jgi:poly-gamma-glutamate synthesis protein (capsule biosynthesis protein)
MAYPNEDNGKRRGNRRPNRQRKRDQALRRRRYLIIGIAAAVLVALSVLLIILLQPGSAPQPTEPTQESTLPLNTDPTEPETKITIAFGGDLNITDKVVNSGANEIGYDYTDVFMDIAPTLAGADAAIINLEGNFSTDPYGTLNTSAPAELAKALAAAGVDMVQTANSCSINNGLLGLRQTINTIRYAGMEPLGTYVTPQEQERSRGFVLRDINGIKVAFVAFTKGLDGLSLPVGSEGCVNLLYTDYTSTYTDVNTEGIRRILQDVALEKPDVTVALLHWGSAYNSIVSQSQEKIVQLMQDEGVDAIIGTHSHYVQDIAYDAANSTFVAYSLGDLLGDAEKHYTNASAILQLEFTRDNNTGITTISGYDYTPVFICEEEVDGQPRLKLLRIRQAIEAYEANSIHRVSDAAYEAMKAALSRIESKLDPET